MVGGKNGVSSSKAKRIAADRSPPSFFRRHKRSEDVKHPPCPSMSGRPGRQQDEKTGLDGWLAAAGVLGWVGLRIEIFVRIAP